MTTARLICRREQINQKSIISRLVRHLGRRNRLRAKPDFTNRFKLIWVVQSRSQKYSAFRKPQISGFFPCIPLRQEGRYGQSSPNARRDAMDVKAPKTNGAVADGKVVWS
jgi:hypothetical protein